ncbi:S1C family serine protease [Sporosarcina quadrami]|nr:serine protease [Sporosarcina quadrami]
MSDDEHTRKEHMEDEKYEQDVEQVDLSSIDDEDLTEEQMNKLVLKAQEESRLHRKELIPTKRIPKWFIWMLSITLVLSTVAGLFQVFSIPAIDFLMTSAKLSQEEDISIYKESVVVVVSEDGKGTGFSISKDGIILTNYHVIENKESIYVVFPEDGRFEATVLETFEDIDVAVLKIEGSHFPSLTLAENPKIEKDDAITFIGNPLSFKGIVNEGTILAPLKLADWQAEVMMIQAPVYRGNSGSPVFNKAGEVIGIVFATLNHNEYGKVGLFIPIDLYYDKLK